MWNRSIVGETWGINSPTSHKFLKGGEMMGKTKPPKGFFRKTVHIGGSSVSESVLTPNPLDGFGRNTKPFATRFRRHYFFSMMREAKRTNQPESIPAILAIYRKG